MARPAGETARSARLSAAPAVPIPPLGGVASHRIPRLVVVACLARYASSLAGATFAPAQPPSVAQWLTPALREQDKSDTEATQSIVI